MDQITAGILGLAAGDALGVPVEFCSRGELEAAPVTGMRAYGSHHQPAGTWSDDTSMTLCLMDSLARRQGRIDCDDIMRSFRAWLKEGRFNAGGRTFDVGITCNTAIEDFCAGKPAAQCGLRDVYSNGNGSLMRILPVAFLPLTEQEAMDAASQVSALTHAHAISRVACAMYVVAAREFLAGRRDVGAAIEKGWRAAAEHFCGGAMLPELRRIPALAALAPAEIHSGGYVVESLEAAYYCLLKTTNYRDAVLLAVNLGSDTDTTAAITGGLAGLLYGAEDRPGSPGIPQEWLAALRRRDAIEALCGRLEAALAPQEGAAAERGM